MALALEHEQLASEYLAIKPRGEGTGDRPKPVRSRPRSGPDDAGNATLDSAALLAPGSGRARVAGYDTVRDF